MLTMKLTEPNRKIIRDTIHGVTKGDIRRLARRGGVKRISANIYDEIRTALKARLETVGSYLCLSPSSSLCVLMRVVTVDS